MKNFFISSVLFLSFFLTGCQGLGSSTPTAEIVEQNNDSAKLTIVTSFYPLAFFVEEIVGDMAEVINLAENQEVHDFRLSPKDIITLNNADLVIYQGAELESWTEDMIPQLQAKNISTLEVSKALNLHKIEEHEEDESHTEEDDEHHHGEFDPHTWLDPVLAQVMIDQISKKISISDPKNINTYKGNTESLKQKLQAFDMRFQNLSCLNDEAVISHDAFGYLSRRYKFTLHPMTGFSTADQPSANLLAKLTEELGENVTHILTEENSIKAFAQTLADETGLIMIPVYTLETNIEPFLSGYEKNLNSLKTALQCQ